MKKTKRGVHYVFNDSGHDFPNVFKDHRGSFSQKPTDLAAYRRQVTYRSLNIGTNVIAIILSDYLAIHMEKMSYQ